MLFFSSPGGSKYWQIGNYLLVLLFDLLPIALASHSLSCSAAANGSPPQQIEKLFQGYFSFRRHSGFTYEA